MNQLYLNNLKAAIRKNKIKITPSKKPIKLLLTLLKEFLATIKNKNIEQNFKNENFQLQGVEIYFFWKWHRH